MKKNSGNKSSRKIGNDNKLGIYLRSLRESLNLSQTDVACALNIVQQTYSHYETGRIIPPTKTLVSLARFYNVPAEDLIALTSDGSDIASEVSDYDPEAAFKDRIKDRYNEYLRTPVNISRLRFLSESEKRLIFLFSQLDAEDKQDLLDFMLIRNKSRQRS